MALTAKKMAKNNCIVKNLDSVETLGIINTICCDKTGTLTENRMTASHIWCNGSILSVEPPNMDCSSLPLDSNDPAIMALVRVAALCNRAEFQYGQVH